MKGIDPDRLDWNKGGGLLPAIVQDATTGRVLMLGYMSRAALDATRSTGWVTFFSRSRQRLWTKGETSGNRLAVVDVVADCDGDALLVRARPSGPVCHTGAPCCFPPDPDGADDGFGFLAILEAVIDARIAAPTASSYVAALQAQGARRIAQKIGEEGVEVALAAASGSDAELVAESADLLFHLAVALRTRGLSLAAVAAELGRRHAERGAAP